MTQPEINASQQQLNARHCAARGIQIPTFAEMRHPERIGEAQAQVLKGVGLWDLHPANLYRITWKNEPKPSGGLFGGVNCIELPSALTGTRARVIGLSGKWFPTGAHKVGATFGCLVPELISGRFNPIEGKAAWPSTGNYCRGGAYVSKLLGCASIAILPEGMSRERFEWLEHIADEVIKTHGCESNVKEIFDMCWELRRTRPEVQIFNQFAEMGNTLWHYEVTGPAMAEAVRAHLGPSDRFAGTILSSGSGGTLAGGYYMKEQFPGSKLAAAEALQCATMLDNGWGDHRIEGIGDKHIPWIHDVKNTDMAIGVDDERALRLLRLFNEPAGHQVLKEEGVSAEIVAQLDTLGISGIANMIASIKFAKYYELTEQDVVLTVFTDSMELYGSRLEELTASQGVYTERSAVKDLDMLWNTGIDHAMELSYYDRKRIHNLKYYTWVEQQHEQASELRAQWESHDTYWPAHLKRGAEVDSQIEAFNEMIRHYQK